MLESEHEPQDADVVGKELSHRIDAELPPPPWRL
jgi:hypothetical protein